MTFLVKNIARSLLCGTGLCLFASTSYAQSQAANAPAATSAPVTTPTDSFGDITVTARRRSENLQKVPVSISVVSTETLNQMGNSDIKSLSQMVTGLESYSPTDRSNLDFTIRGQGYTYGTLFPAVIVYFDEIPLERANDGNFFDIDAVQVLKGPQGTLFGRVTDGGAVLLNSHKPTNNFEGFVDAKVGNYDEHELQGAINIPIVNDKILLRIAGDINRRDGYTRNLYSGKDLDNISYEAARISLTIKPVAGIENTTVVNYNHSHTNGDGTVLVGYNPLDFATPALRPFIAQYAAALAQQQALGPRVVDEGFPGPLSLPGDSDGLFYLRKALYAVNKLTADLSDTIHLKNILGYIYNREQNGVTGPVPTLANPNGIYPRFDQYYEQWSDETQLQGTLFKDRLDFTVGAYFDKQDVPGKAEQLIVLDAAEQYSLEQYPTTKSKAGYGNLGVKILPGLKASAGVRYTDDSVVSYNANYIAFNLDPSSVPHGQCLSGSQLAAYPLTYAILPCLRSAAESKVWTWNFGIDYQITRDVFTYATYRKGYRPGGFNATSGGGIAYKPEYTKELEIGIKSTWDVSGVKFRTNVALFHDQYFDMQKQVTFISPITGLPVTGLTNVKPDLDPSAPAAIVKGFDFDGSIIPFKGLNISGSWTYESAKYNQSKFSSIYYTSACVNRATTAPNEEYFCPSDPLQQSPKNSVLISAHYTLPLNDSVGVLTIGGSGYYVSANYEDSDDPVAGTIPAHTVFNIDATWKRPFGAHIDLSFYINNVTNLTYEASITNYLTVGNLGAKQALYAEPRMYGTSIHYSW